MKISILPLAEQYLSFIETAQELNLEVAADYLVMAAWLAYLKSRLLLPEAEPEADEEIIDMTDALRFQLLRLEAMQEALKSLASLPKLVGPVTREESLNFPQPLKNRSGRRFI